MTRSSSGIRVALSSRSRTFPSIMAWMTWIGVSDLFARPSGWSRSITALSLVIVLSDLRSRDHEISANGSNFNCLPSLSRSYDLAYIQ